MDSVKVKVTKLDGRHSHTGLFSHMLQFRHLVGYQPYQQALHYCNTQWGPSVDVETYSKIYWDAIKRNYQFNFNPTWSYLARYGDHRIYLTEDATAWIQLAEPWNT